MGVDPLDGIGGKGTGKGGEVLWPPWIRERSPSKGFSSKWGPSGCWGCRFLQFLWLWTSLAWKNQNTAASDQKIGKGHKECGLAVFVPHLFIGDNLEQERDIALKRDWN